MERAVAAASHHATTIIGADNESSFHHRKILLNLAGVYRVDSAGSAHIIAGSTSARKHKGDLKLLNPAKELQDVLKFTAMLSVLEFSNDEAAAVKSFTESASTAGTMGRAISTF